MRENALRAMENVDSQLVAHPVDLLDVGEDHLGVDPLVPDHGLHVVGGEEVGDARVAPEKHEKQIKTPIRI